VANRYNLHENTIKRFKSEVKQNKPHTTTYLIPSDPDLSRELESLAAYHDFDWREFIKLCLRYMKVVYRRDPSTDMPNEFFELVDLLNWFKVNSLTVKEAIAKANDAAELLEKEASLLKKIREQRNKLESEVCELQTEQTQHQKAIEMMKLARSQLLKATETLQIQKEKLEKEVARSEDRLNFVQNLLLVEGGKLGDLRKEIHDLQDTKQLFLQEISILREQQEEVPSKSLEELISKEEVAAFAKGFEMFRKAKKQLEANDLGTEED